MAAVGTLTIEMAANVARLQKDMDRATKTVGGAMDRIQKSVQGATRALGLLTAAFATVKSIQGIIQQADAMTQLNSRLKLVTTSQEEFAKIQGALISISQRTYTSIGATVDLYTALARSTKEVGVSQNELLRVVETFNKSIIISGGSVQAAEAAITQFNQAMASGVLRGEEFNSISEQAPMIMEILSNSLGVTRGALRDMAKEGLLVADLVLPALLEGSKSVDEQFNNMNTTVGQATNELSQSLALLINEIDQSTGFTKTLAEAITSLSSSIRGLSTIVDDNKYALMAWAGIFLSPAIVAGMTTLIASLGAFRVAILGVTAALAANPIALALLAITAAAIPAINAMNNYFAAQEKAKEGQNGFNESSAETNRLLRQNEEAARSNNEAVRSTAKAILEKKKADELAKKAAEDLKKAYDSLIQSLKQDLIQSTAELQAEQQGLNKAQESYLVLVSSPEWKQYTEAQRMLITDLFKQRIETEQLIDLEKKRAKAAEDRLKKMLDDEKEFRAELKKEDEKLAAEKLKKEEEFFAQQRKQIQQIEDQLTDALMRAFESGKGFGQAFKDTLINMFRTMVLRPILAPIVGGLVGGASGSAMAGTGTMDLISGATQMYSIVTTGFAKVGATVSAALQNAGDYLATSSIDAVAAGGEFLQTIAQAAGPIASSIAGAATGMFLNSMISGGYSTGKTMDTFQKIGITVASFVGGPVLGAIVGAATGVFNRLFGRKLKDVGIQGTFGESGFAGESFRFEKGGLFRSDKTRTSALDADLESFLGDSFVAIRGATAAMAVTLGQSADSIFSFTKDIKLSFMGLNEEQIQALLTEQFELLGDELAQLALGTEEFTRRGESASETLQRLYQSVINVNSVFDTLGLSMFDLTLVGADMASQLVDLFGGIENFVNATTAYYEAFYTEAERTDILTRQLTTSFEQLGLQLPTSRIALRELIEAQDLTTQSGRELFAALMNLTPAFSAITKSTEQIEEEIRLLMDQATQRRLDADKAQLDAQKAQADRMAEIQAEEAEARFKAEQKVLQDLENAYDNAQETVSNALATIERSINAQKQSLQLSAQLGEEQIRNIESVFDVLNSAILDLTGGGFTAITGQAFIQQALLAAQNTGYLPDPNELSRAISAARGGLTSGAGSAFEARREQALLVARLTQLRGFAEDQLSTEEQTLRGINLQIAQLDAQLSAAQEQVNVLRGIDTGIRDIPTSIAALQASISNELKILADLQAQQAKVATPVVVPTPVIPTSSVSTPGTGAITLNTAGLQQTGPFAPGYGPGIGQTGSNSITINRPAGTTGTQTITIGGQKVDVLTLNTSGLRGFAAGGLHSGGMRMVGERGPELEMTGPARYMSNANLASLMGNNSNEEVKQLREENRVQLRAMVSLQNRMTKVIEQWNGDGLPTERVEA
jgi:tape measure domain-containing protein